MDKSLDLFCSILSRETGLTFPTSRYSFVLNRLTPLLEKYAVSNPCELILKSKQDLKLRIDIVNELTTNETWFFRHPEHFEILKDDVLPEIIRRKKDKSLNIWSAGCSIGAELYSILITIRESLPDYNNYRINILGSDISYEAVQLAKKAVYDNYDLRATDKAIINKYFDKQDNDTFRIKDELRTNVSFEFLNLLETWPPRNFDIIFCRNTMIYFNKEIKKSLVKRFFKALELNGYFFTSTNELIDVKDDSYGVKKLYLRNECIYQKTSNVNKTVELFFKNSTELLKATNLLRKVSFSFEFGPAIKDNNGKEISSLLVSSSNYEKILKYLISNSVIPSNHRKTFR